MLILRRFLILGTIVAAVGVVLRRLTGRSERGLATVVTPGGARAVVEASLTRRAKRSDLTLDFEPATATRLDLLIDGAQFFPRMLEDIEAATTDVHILIFGFKAGQIGDRFRDVLVEKVAAGVGVRIITEAAFSQPGLGSKEFYASLVAGGVQVVANQGAFLDLDGPLGQRRVDWRLDDLGHFDHRKVVIVDGRVGYVGGPGIEDHYVTGTHDLMLRLEGPIVAQLQAVFLQSWRFQGGPLDAAAGLDRFFPPIADAPGTRMRILHNNPGEGYLPIRTAFQAAVDGATERLYVISPYLSDHGILRGLVEAAKRGVKVRAIVPSNPHSLPASASVRHWFRALRDAGVDLREHPEMAHAKVVLSDDTVLVGTANLDALSLRQNWEMQLQIEDREVADLFARELFDRDVTIATPAVMPTGWKDRAVNAVMSALAPLL
ncbi:MAG TPA: phospholipase D-like domain-containing protein [Candidatus Limnocylindrales bacterium]|nr:phospholipase D-like domain-containing protein [Candidatus Limnocylindrales bacterium]